MTAPAPTAATIYPIVPHSRMAAYRWGRSFSTRKVMLLAKGISGVRKAAKQKMPSAAGTKRCALGRMSAASAESQVVQRKMRSPLRVASAYAAQRKGATVATPGMMALSSPISEEERPNSRHRGVR